MKKKSSKFRYVEQGDVILIKRSTIKGKKQKTNVVQEGEHTGHAHRFEPGTAEVLLDSKSAIKYLRTGGTSITHEEHAPIIVEEGDYEVRIVRQKDPFSKIVAPVVD